MSDFTPKMKEDLEAKLKELNEELKKAKDSFEQLPRPTDETKKAVVDALKQLMQAASVKEEVLSFLPGIDVKPGVVLPAEPVFHTFFDVDMEISKLVVRKFSAAEDEEMWRKALSKLRVLVEEIRTNLLGKHKPADPKAAQDLEDLATFVSDLADFIKTGLENEDLDTSFLDDHWKKFIELAQNIREAKKSFLNRFATPLPLWTVYEILYEINWELHVCHWSVSWLFNIDDIGADLQELIDKKNELEGLVSKTPAKEK